MTLFEINLWKTSFWTELSKGVGGPTEGSPGAGAAAGEGAGAAAGGAAAGAGAGAGAGFTWPWTWLLTWPLDGLFFAVGASFGTLTALEEAASAGLLWRGAGAAGCSIAPSGLSAFGLGTGATGATGGVPWGGIVFGGTGPPFPFSGKRKGLGLAASGGWRSWRRWRWWQWILRRIYDNWRTWRSRCHVWRCSILPRQDLRQFLNPCHVNIMNDIYCFTWRHNEWMIYIYVTMLLCLCLIQMSSEILHQIPEVLWLCTGTTIL